MNLEELTDEQTTTKKMRSALRRGDTPKKEVDKLSKRKNPNPDPHNSNASGQENRDNNEDEIDVDAMSAGATT